MSADGKAKGHMRFVGRIMQAWFTTPTDLSDLLPDGLVVADPHRAFLKVYELKALPVGGRPLPPAFSQYKQVCVSVLGGPRDMPARHINLMMWESRSWSMGTGGLAWHKKYGTIEITRLHPVEERYRTPDEAIPFAVSVDCDGARVLQFDGELDGVKRTEPPPLNGFYLSDASGARLYALYLVDSYLGEPWYGQGALSFSPTPGEAGSTRPAGVLRDSQGRPVIRPNRSYALPHAGILGEVDCAGFAVQDVMFLRDFADLEDITDKVSLPA